MPPIPFAQAITIIAVVSAVTLILRATPFLIFAGNKKPPTAVAYLGRVLPPAVMAILIVYCLKDLVFTDYRQVLPAALSIVAVAFIHWKWRNTLISIGAGTGLYMLLVQFVF